MMFVSRLRKLFLFRLCSLLLTGFLAFGQTARSETQPITFAYENITDLRGILNVFAAFRQACLDQSVTSDLPEKLVPEGYQVVTLGYHIWGEKTDMLQNTMVLSKTGQEESDLSEGAPIIELQMPTKDAPNGKCWVRWTRKWDYADHRENLALSIAAMLDAWASYHLKAILVSQPVDGFVKADDYGKLSDWVTGCRTRETCQFVLFASLNQKDGIELKLSRDGVLAASVGK